MGWILALLTALGVGGSFYGGWSRKKEMESQERLGMRGLDIEEKKATVEKEGMTELNAQKLAMIREQMGKAMTMRDTDWKRQIEVMREQYGNQREMAAEERMEKSMDNKTAMQLELIRSLMTNAQNMGPSRPGDRIPLTRLIGLGD